MMPMPRRPGRPRREGPPRSPRSVLLETSVEDALCRLALKHGLSVHALLKFGAVLVLEQRESEIARRFFSS